MQPAYRKMQFPGNRFFLAPAGADLRLGRAFKGVACRFSPTVGSVSNLATE
jgi:hypothetical protein